MPKSVTFSVPSGHSSRFAGLMSRCTRPAACAADSADAAWPRIDHVRSASSDPSRSSTSDNGSPRISSMTRYGGSFAASSPSPKSKTCATLGCTSIAACCASSRKRRRNVGSPACSSRSTLTATDRPRTRSSAHQTPPPPPTRSRSSSRYRPPRASEGALVTSLPYPPCASGHTCVSYRNRRDSGSVLLGVKPPLVIATASLAAVLAACGTQTAGDTTLAALQLTDAGAPAEAAPAQAGGANGAYGFVLQTTLPAAKPPAAPGGGGGPPPPPAP